MSNQSEVEKEIVDVVEKSLKAFGFISGERKCYTPKYGDKAYTIETWDARDVGIFISQDLASFLSQRETEARIEEAKWWTHKLTHGADKSELKFRIKALKSKENKHQYQLIETHEVCNGNFCNRYGCECGAILLKKEEEE